MVAPLHKVVELLLDPELHQRDGAHDDEQDHRCGRRAAVVPRDEGLVVDVQAQQCGRRTGAALAEGEDEVKGLEAVDDEHHQHKEVAGRQHGEGDGLELLPLGRAVDAGSLVQTVGDVLQGGQVL